MQSRFFLFFCLLLLLTCAAGAQQNVPQAATVRDLYSDTWVGVDGLSRALPTFEDVGPPRPNKTVGIFYFLWLDGRTGVINDNSKVLAADPNAVIPYEAGQWDWWGEPLFGYYQNTDPFVLRKHAQMLSDAGIDTLIFDSSNSYLHEEQYTALSEVYESMRRLGDKTPQFFHLTNAKSGPTVQKIYDEFYSRNLDPDLWFRWQGKPLILAHPAELTPTLNDYFSVRYSWAWSGPKGWFGDGHDKWPWLDNYPQNYGWDTNPQTPEEISVCVAQHATSTIGRSYHAHQEPPSDQRDSAVGLNFTEQWSQALKVDPPFVFVTGWNEWIAPIGHDPGRKFLGHVLGQNDAFFVDEYSPEFSRDIEPMSPDSPGGFGDDYYYQLVGFVRRYKGARPLPPVTPRAIHLSGGFGQWQSVQPEYRDAVGDPVQRDFPGFAKGTSYVNHTGRNDIVAAKVAYDAKDIYFYVRTAQKLTPPTDPDWMLLYLNTDRDYKTGWLGYDFVLNRKVGSNTTRLERNVGGRYEWQPVAQVQYRAAGSELMIAVPRSLLSLTRQPAVIDFKWADHCYAKGDWTDFTLNGDAAPDDRFNYRAKLAAQGAK